jgi:hypothetical protein
VYVTGIYPVGNVVSIGINNRWSGKAVALCDRPDSGGDTQVITSLAPLSIQTAIQVDDEKLSLP